MSDYTMVDKLCDVPWFQEVLAESVKYLDTIPETAQSAWYKEK